MYENKEEVCVQFSDFIIITLLFIIIGPLLLFSSSLQQLAGGPRAECDGTIQPQVRSRFIILVVYRVRIRVTGYIQYSLENTNN